MHIQSAPNTLNTFQPLPFPVFDAAIPRSLASLDERPMPANASVAPGGSGLPAWKARKIAAHIDGNLGDSLRLPELGAVVGLSTSYFSKAFKHSFGETAHVYIVRRRVAQAKSLMLETRQALCDIAIDCGFTDQAHMTRLFGRLVGESPARWRRRGQSRLH